MKKSKSGNQECYTAAWQFTPTHCFVDQPDHNGFGLGKSSLDEGYSPDFLSSDYHSFEYRVSGRKCKDDFKCSKFHW